MILRFTIEEERLMGAYEEACHEAARQYAEGLDTTDIDREVNRLHAELLRRNLA